jgi:hypothetical protein
MLNIPAEIKELLKSDSVHKNFRVHFPNGEREDITNENIISESVSFTESICSNPTLQFGLCETPMIQFETFGVDNVKGATIECHMEIYCDSSVVGSVYRDDIDAYIYPIPYGRYVVDSCKKQADLTHRKFICYNEIVYQNWEFPSLVKEAIESILWKDKSLTISLEAIMGMMLPGYGRNYTRITGQGSGSFPLFSIPFTRNNTNYMLYMYINTYNITFQMSSDPAFSVVKEHYSAEYIKNVNKVTEKLIKLNFFDDVFSIDDGLNSFSKQQVAINTSSSAYRYYNMSVGVSIDQSPKGVSKIYKPTNDAIVAPYVYLESGGSSSYPHWQISNGGYFEGLGTMSSLIFNFHPPGWARCVGLELVDVTHSETIASALLSAEDDYIDYEMDCIKFLEGDSGIKFTPKFSSKKIKMTTKSGTTKQKIYRATLNFLNQRWKDVFNAYAEIQGKFGKFNRYGDIEFISLKDNLTALYPSETLYPSPSLFPMGNVGIKVNESYYESLWYDDYYSLPVGRVTVTYNDSVEGEDYQIDVYCNGFTEDSSPARYRTYDLTENVLIKSKTWTEEAMTDILDTIAANVTGITYMPCELEMKGRPDLEAGDVVEITTTQGRITTIVLHRTITGIQLLTDDVTST